MKPFRGVQRFQGQCFMFNSVPLETNLICNPSQNYKRVFCQRGCRTLQRGQLLWSNTCSMWKQKNNKAFSSLVHQRTAPGRRGVQCSRQFRMANGIRKDPKGSERIRKAISVRVVLASGHPSGAPHQHTRRGLLSRIWHSDTQSHSRVHSGSLPVIALTKNIRPDGSIRMCLGYHTWRDTKIIPQCSNNNPITPITIQER